ncbi:MAG: TM0996/MTH895 family glutaredoxin-like protein [Nitrospinae bacterium]|nr:TM0996/MTH895 family glutaredoxin-like protein [Nitrospinota bacterium]
MKIIVAGPGCARCMGTEKVVAEVVRETGIQAEVEHVFDVREYAKLGVRLTPAVIIDGVIVLSGSVPTAEAVKKALAR